MTLQLLQTNLFENDSDIETLSASQVVSRAKLFQRLGSGKGSKIHEAHSFLKLHGSHHFSNLATYSLRTSQDCSTTMEGLRSRQSSERWMNWGMMRSGNVTTARITSHKTGSEYSLSDILEEQVPEKYFLSEQVAKKLLTATSLRTRSLQDIRGGNVKAHILSRLGTEEERQKLLEKKQRFSNNDAGVSDGQSIRKLTPLECWRLQGFPDDLFYKAKQVNSDSQLYKQAGNSVTVPVIYEIAKRLEGDEEE